MRGPERRHETAFEQHAGVSVSAPNRVALFGRQPWQQAVKDPGEHGFAGSGRPDEHRRVVSDDGQAQRQTGPRFADEVFEPHFGFTIAQTVPARKGADGQGGDGPDVFEMGYDLAQI
jgi:hypothetical protein